MRVCIVRQAYFPEEAHVRKNVDALLDAGYDVDVVCLREKGAPARGKYRNANIRRLPLMHKRAGKLRYLFEYGAFALMTAITLALRSIFRRYDTVEVYNIPDTLVFATLPARIRGSRIVFYMFELMPEQVRDEFEMSDSSPLIRILRWVERRAVHFAHRVIVVGPYDKELIEKRSAPRGEPVVVLNVPDEKLFAPVATNGNGNSRPFTVLTHGSILQRYGIQTLVRAVPQMASEVTDLRVRIIGEGEYRDELRRLARELGVERQVEFTDWMPVEEIPACIADADVGVVPLSVPWLLPNKLFEYVAMRRPVVAAASPSLTPIFDDQCVSYFDRDDARALAEKVIAIYRDKRLADGLVDRASAVYDTLCWETMKRRYISAHAESAGGQS